MVTLLNRTRELGFRFVMINARLASIDATKTKRFEIAIIGDIRVEMRTSFRSVAFDEITEDTFLFAPIHVTIAGSAMNMAKAAVQLFARVHVLSCIGSDEFTPLIREAITLSGAVPHVVVDGGLVNGAVMVLRDRPRSGPLGRRLLISSAPSPNHNLTVEDVVKLRHVIDGSDVLFVDGYSLLGEVSRESVLRAQHIAHQSSTTVCLDLVPHRIDEYLSLPQVVPHIRAADVVISEARTIARLCKLPAPYPFTGDCFSQLLAFIDDSLPTSVHWILRFGEADIQEVLLHSRDGSDVHFDTGYVELGTADRAGFGDYLAASELRWLLERG